VIALRVNGGIHGDLEKMASYTSHKVVTKTGIWLRTYHLFEFRGTRELTWHRTREHPQKVEYRSWQRHDIQRQEDYDIAELSIAL